MLPECGPVWTFDRAGRRRAASKPDLNPIEMVFAKLTHLLQKAGERTREGLWNRIGSLLDDFPPHQCSNYFKHAGYATV